MTDHTKRYDDAMKVLDESPNIKRVVGHSLGGAVALQIDAENQNKYKTVTYGAPVASLEGSADRHRYFGDPINILHKGAKSDLSLDFTPHKFSRFDDEYVQQEA